MYLAVNAELLVSSDGNKGVLNEKGNACPAMGTQAGPEVKRKPG
jgi:hypothetical protein